MIGCPLQSFMKDGLHVSANELARNRATTSQDGREVLTINLKMVPSTNYGQKRSVENRCSRFMNCTELNHINGMVQFNL
ncbi:hypothetical protein A2U01_0031120 [Trifolium medium]|uniref:Uncharacterized protein n=1 Tax=Trifolium medium TaxID=97028 RepID=A0A392PEX3_9FABA|nr:hypothetical protein [Trifolium medium]